MLFDTYFHISRWPGGRVPCLQTSFLFRARFGGKRKRVTRCEPVSPVTLPRRPRGVR
jgi:hypothetical protein